VKVVEPCFEITTALAVHVPFVVVALGDEDRMAPCVLPAVELITAPPPTRTAPPVQLAVLSEVMSPTVEVDVTVFPATLVTVALGPVGPVLPRCVVSSATPMLIGLRLGHGCGSAGGNGVVDTAAFGVGR
jgi:hypothetical protein